jgi:carotenoid cleavage dioxygenase-like enzyme
VARVRLPPHGRAIRHGWFAITTPPESEHGVEMAGLCHLDLSSGREDLWDPGTDIRAGEGFVVPTEQGKGWVLTYLWDRTTDLSSLAVFDAQSVQDGPVGQVRLPVRVPFGFHGLWVDEADL